MDGAGGSADHPGQGHGLVGVADDERVGAQVVGGAIEGGEGLAVPGRTQIEHGRIEATRANVSEAVAIKRMQGLAQLQHHQIGDVHHVVDRPQAGTLQPLLQPQRRGANLQIAQRREAEQTARFDAVLHSGRHRQIAGCHGRGCRRQVERAASEGGHLASDTAHRQAIGSVGGDRQLQHLIIEAEQRTDGAADGWHGFEGFIEDDDAIGTVRQAQFGQGADHAAAGDATQFSRLDRQVHSRQVRPHRGDSHVDTGADVAGAADDLQWFCCAGGGACCCGVGRCDPHGADAQLVGVGMGLAGFHIAHHHAGSAGGQILNPLDLEAGHREPFRQGVAGQIAGHKLPQPLERDLHCMTRQLWGRL